MIKSIWKYPLEIVDEQIIEMPEHSRILTAQVQNGVICIWALVNTQTITKEKIHIRVIGTGHIIEDFAYLRYISTIQLHNGALVFSIFEKVIEELK